MDGNLKQRLGSAFVLILAVALLLFVGGRLLTAVAVLVYGLINWELYRIIPIRDSLLRTRLVAANLTIPLGYLLWDWPGLFGGLVLSLTVHFVLQIVHVESATHEQPYAESLPGSFLALCYTGVLGANLVILSTAVNANRYLAWVLSIVVLTDSFAYFGGRLIKGEKMSPRISPNKTVSGGVCGLLGAVAASLVFGRLLALPADTIQLIFFGILAGVLAEFGDLAESAIKRIYQVKDISQLIPGHGGLLDRIDALIFTAPILYLVNF